MDKAVDEGKRIQILPGDGIQSSVVLDDDNLNTTQTPEFTKDKYNAKINK
jgi:hypothetical protein